MNCIKKNILMILASTVSVIGLSVNVVAASTDVFDVSDAPIPSLNEEINQKNSTIYSLDMPSKREIQSKYFELGMDDTPSTVYKSEYSVSAPYSAGDLSSETLQQALNTVNFIRFVAGLDPVSLNDTYNSLAQHASLVSAANGYLDHFPSQPSGMSEDMYSLGKQGAGSSNLGYGYSSIPDSIIRGYMEDTDTSNIDRVGHRRWILNPPMQEIGFGKVGIFTATYVFDNTFGGNLSDDFIAWPPQNMPYELYLPSSMGYAFSVNLGYEYDTPSIDNVTVEIYSELQNKTWVLDKNSTDKNNSIHNFFKIFF